MTNYRINDQLRDLYNEKVNALELDLKQMPSATNPFLIKTLENYHSADIKIMFFGQETNTWYNNLPFNVDELMRKYHDFFDDITNRDAEIRRPFFQMYRSLREIAKIDKTEKSGFVWNNVLKIGKRDGKGTPSKAIIDMTFKNFDVLQSELNILKPDLLVFFSGPDYDRFIRQSLGNFTIINLENCENRKGCSLKFENNYNPAHAIRTYHPGYLRRSGLWNEISTELRNAFGRLSV
jgi:hypothetical protein